MKSKPPLLQLACLVASTLIISSCGESGGATPNSVSETGKDVSQAGSDMVEFLPQYPPAEIIGTPVPIDDIPNLEKFNPNAAPTKPPAFNLPRDAKNVALGKPVSGSDLEPLLGGLELLTDGDAQTGDGRYAEFAPGHQWVQIDLGQKYDVWKLLVWHLHRARAVYFDVNIQVSNVPKFETGVTTLYNNDHDDSSKLGKGEDMAYVETHHGRLIDGKGTNARYVRLYSNGNTSNEMNHYIEVQVYGTPPK
ncbi:discoidin domain-containing protein [Verrucomicrobium spinosum]|uniref:discoidin domain-containing protein n=1 Tax=Verrucomicrobium spinosum TaxID=2736 RepID=UPI000492B510|nr:discoidin domain-containing protein [Verrucomicrobium spinosum]